MIKNEVIDGHSVDGDLARISWRVVVFRQYLSNSVEKRLMHLNYFRH